MTRKRKDYRELKVSSFSGYGYKSAPMLRIQGLWLEELGFNIGDPILVKCEDGKLIITVDHAREDAETKEQVFDVDEKEFYYTYIDLDEIHEDLRDTVPEPVPKSIPEEYESFFEGHTGTMVVLSNCDRMDGTGKKTSPSEMNGLIATYLGRTYRKFIEAGLKIYLDDRQVYMHDPLYVSGPTQFDTKEKQDPKAEIYATSTIELPIPGREGETAEVTIRISLLPKEWRLNIGDGGNAEARKRKIDQNEGVSILRANREVLYDKVPYLIGLKKGQFSYQERVFDVTVNSKGEILRYDIQNIKGNLFIEDVEVHQQIMAALAEK